jgi:CRP/FNR family transcriptional regulator
MLILDIFRHIPFFASLSETELRGLYEDITLEFYPAGHHIFKEGEKADALYILREGQVKVYKKEGEHQKHLAVLLKNDVFGEMALIENSTRTASILPLQDTECFVIKKPVLERLLQNKKVLREQLAIVYKERILRNKSYG